MSELSTKAIPSRKRATILLAAGGYVNTGIVIIQGLLLMPMYLHYIGAHTYGLWLASGGILGMLALMNFGISSMLIQRVSSAYAQQDFDKSSMYFFNGMIVYLVISVLFGIVGYSFSFWLPDVLSLTDKNVHLLQTCFQIAVVAMIISIVNECLRSFSQALLRPLLPVLGMALGRILGIAVTVWMLLYDWGLWALPIGLFVSEAFIFIVNIYHVAFLVRQLGGRTSVNMNMIKEYVRTAPALLGARVGQGVAQESEPLLIAILLSPEMTAVYMIVRRAADIVFNLLSQIVGSVLGTFGHLAGAGDVKKTSEVAFALMAVIALLGMIGFAVYIVMNETFIHLWVGDEYLLSQTVVIFLGVAFFFRIVRSMVWQLLNGMGEFVYTSLCILFEGMFRISLLVLCVPMFGIVGVPCALLLSSALSLYLLMKRMHREIRFVYEIRMLVLYALSLLTVLGFSVLLGLFMPTLSWFEFTGVLLIVVSVYLIFTLVVNWRLCEKIKVTLFSK